jgi:hypothetical protein
MELLDRLLRRRLSLAEVVQRTSLSAVRSIHSQVHALVTSRAFPGVLGTDSAVLNKAGRNLVAELAAFTLHLADRIAARVLRPEQRREFTERLVDSLSSSLSTAILKGASPGDQVGFRDRCADLCHARASLYASLRVPEVGAAPVTGTLFWQAGRQCAERLFGGDATATLRLPLVFGRCMDAVEDLRNQLLNVADE